LSIKAISVSKIYLSAGTGGTSPQGARAGGFHPQGFRTQSSRPKKAHARADRPGPITAGDFPEDGNKVVAIENVSIDINEGSYTFLTGPTGSGKTTLLSLLAGIVRPTEGQIAFGVIHTPDAKDEQVSQFRERFIGYIPQDTLLLNELTVLENVLSPNVFLKKRMKDIKSRALSVLEGLGLASSAGRRPFELSGGEMKKVMIARALVKEPVYLFADEPFTELDEDSTHRLLGLFAELHDSGSAVVVASHAMRAVADDADHYVLEGGRIIDYRKEEHDESHRPSVQAGKMRAGRKHSDGDKKVRHAKQR
jgi:putative ABC transport system ATP-binding protein